MKKSILFFIVLAIVNTSCRSLTSTTYIKANDSFVLGNNKHGAFNVDMKNASTNNLEVYHAPIDGGKHSTVIVKPNESVKVKVDAKWNKRIESCSRNKNLFSQQEANRCGDGRKSINRRTFLHRQIGR